MENFRCCNPNFYKDIATLHEENNKSTKDQIKVEERIEQCFMEFREILELDENIPELKRKRHISYVLKGLSNLSESHSSLDASRPWLCYWMLHSLELHGEKLDSTMASQIVTFLNKCQHPDGGFGGGPGQYAHLATTYAAINALCIIATEEAYKTIDRVKLFSFFKSMKQPDGSFTMHKDGEVDIRGTYCTASVARLLNLEEMELFQNTPMWILSCQSYEGGFSGIPGMEAHGGYTFCGLAALILMDSTTSLDLELILRWLSFRQLSFEGGFQGRTNKSVDGCYSFWQGACFLLLHSLFLKDPQYSSSASRLRTWLYSQQALQEYLLICCQHPSGGMLDKPDKNRDYYHTCYCLSGLTISQHFNNQKINSEIIVGPQMNKLEPTHPIFNICLDKVHKIMKYFKASSLL